MNETVRNNTITIITSNVTSESKPSIVNNATTTGSVVTKIVQTNVTNTIISVGGN